MMLDDTYNPVAIHLQRAGQWDLALPHAANDSQRAEILSERFFWQHVGADEAIAAARDLPGSPGQLLLARLSYFHKLFEFDNPIEIDELAVFQAAEGAWAAFWAGVVLDNVHERHEEAKATFDKAAELMGDDPFLESYVVRHQAFHLIETDRPRALALTRRSLALRSSLGARPQTAAAQSALAQVLGEDDPESAELMEHAHRTGAELSIAWLKPKAE
jgi:hypothetical protein